MTMAAASGDDPASLFATPAIVEQTGTALRPYILWRRFLRAWALVQRGDSLSTAAHDAGFADAAHFSRTSSRMFGFPPSALEVAATPGRVREPALR